MEQNSDLLDCSAKSDDAIQSESGELDVNTLLRIAEHYRVRQQQPFEFSIRQFARLLSCSQDYATKLLEMMEKDGVLTCRQGPGRARLYRVSCDPTTLPND